ncbi:cytochrome C556 [Aliidiomarina taiwanensis]|uniref:Cytochrome C556 n=1 Tax=Aliidiomarina taiwanensis TaxID=946228 RepID=A0A432X1Z5_9GAMM|nr:cytochrome c [Aliidiomarina taiwanensis]RUO40514.1 cytochrome C556 [Aliidiomarina taiwanensis]
MKIFKLLPFVAVLGLTCTAPLASADTFVDADDTVEYRQQAFSLIRDNFGIMAGMVRGEITFDATQFQQHADAVKHLAHIPLAGFSGAGENVTKDSAALPKIWQNWDDFNSKMDDLVNAAAELAEAAESGNIRTIAPKFIVTAGTCKQCHDNYKAD